MRLGLNTPHGTAVFGSSAFVSSRLSIESRVDGGMWLAGHGEGGDFTIAPLRCRDHAETKTRNLNRQLGLVGNFLQNLATGTG